MLISFNIEYPAIDPVPIVGGIIPVNIEINVVLPAPLGPKRPNI